MNPFPIAVRRTDESAQFFAMAAEGAVMLRRCEACGACRAPQNAVCVACHSLDWEPVAAAGSASLVSWTVVHRSPVPGLPAPYVAAIVECAEGPWLFVRLLGTEDAELFEDMPVQLITVATGDDGETIVAAQLMKPAGVE